MRSTSGVDHSYLQLGYLPTHSDALGIGFGKIIRLFSDSRTCIWINVRFADLMSYVQIVLVPSLVSFSVDFTARGTIYASCPVLPADTIVQSVNSISFLYMRHLYGCNMGSWHCPVVVFYEVWDYNQTGACSDYILRSGLGSLPGSYYLYNLGNMPIWDVRSSLTQSLICFSRIHPSHNARSLHIIGICVVYDNWTLYCFAWLLPRLSYYCRQLWRICFCLELWVYLYAGCMYVCM